MGALGHSSCRAMTAPHGPVRMIDFAGRRRSVSTATGLVGITRRTGAVGSLQDRCHASPGRGALLPCPSEEEAAARAQAESDRPYGYFGSWKTVETDIDVTGAEPASRPVDSVALERSISPDFAAGGDPRRWTGNARCPVPAMRRCDAHSAATCVRRAVVGRARDASVCLSLA